MPVGDEALDDVEHERQATGGNAGDFNLSNGSLPTGSLH